MYPRFGIHNICVMIRQAIGHDAVGRHDPPRHRDGYVVDRQRSRSPVRERRWSHDQARRADRGVADDPAVSDSLRWHLGQTPNVGRLVVKQRRLLRRLAGIQIPSCESHGATTARGIERFADSGGCRAVDRRNRPPCQPSRSFFPARFRQGRRPAREWTSPLCAGSLPR